MKAYPPFFRPLSYCVRLFTNTRSFFPRSSRETMRVFPLLAFYLAKNQLDLGVGFFPPLFSAADFSLGSFSLGSFDPFPSPPPALRSPEEQQVDLPLFFCSISSKTRPSPLPAGFFPFPDSTFFLSPLLIRGPSLFGARRFPWSATIGILSFSRDGFPLFSCTPPSFG